MRHYLTIAFCMLVWSTWGPMIRWIALPPAVVLFYTSLVAGIAVPVVLRWRGQLKLDVPREHWRLFLALAVSSLVNNLTYFYALGHTTVSNAVLTHYIAPVLVAVFAPLFIAERLQRITLVSLPLAAAGLAMIVVSGGSVSAGGDTAGIIAGAVSGVAYALLIVFSRSLSRMLMHHKAVVVLLWLTIIATAPFALITEHHLTLRAAGLFLVTGLFHSTIASLLYYNALRFIIAQYAAILGYLEPLFAVPLAFLLLGEVPMLWALGGGFLILLSGFLVIRAGMRADAGGEKEEGQAQRAG